MGSKGTGEKDEVLYSDLTATTGKVEKQRKKVCAGMRKIRAIRREALVTESTSAVTQQSPYVENNEAGEGASTTTQNPVTGYVIKWPVLRDYEP